MLIVFFLGIFFLFGFITYVSIRKTITSLPNIFIISNLIFLLGIIYLTDPENNAHLTLIYIHIIGLLSFSFGIFFIRIIILTFKRNTAFFNYKQGSYGIYLESDFYLKRVFAWSLFIFSLFMGFMYFKLVGYNLLSLGFKTLFSTGSFSINDATSLRLATYSGDRYVAPGYFNQFKNVIAVILWQYLFLYYTLIKSKKKYLLIGFLPALLYLLLGTGQRTPLAIATIAFILFSVSVNKYISRKIISISLILFLIFFIILSSVQNRGIEQDAHPTQLIAQGLKQVAERVFLVNSLTALKGFEYVVRMNYPPQLFKETVAKLKNISPINKERNIITIENYIYNYFYGTMRGTGPLSIFSYIWYDARLIGVLFFSFFLGLVFEILSLHIEKEKDLFVMSCWAYGKAVLGTWRAGSIMVIPNRGIISIILLLFLYSLVYNIREYMQKNRDHELSLVKLNQKN